MTTRIQKNEVAKRVASRLSIDEKVSEEYLDAVLETLYEAFKSGESVTLKNFGNFYLDLRRSGCVFKFNPSQKLKALFGWSSTYKRPLQHAKELFAYQVSGADGVQIAVYRKGLASLVQNLVRCSPAALAHSEMTKRNMTDDSDIIEEHLLGRRLIGVWEMISDSSPTTAEGYALSLEGYFLEIKTMLDVSAIGIACGHSRIDFPLDVRPGCSYHEVSYNSPFSQLIGKQFSKWRLMVGEWGNWDGFMVSFGTSAGLCFVSVDCSISVLSLKGAQC